MEKETRRVKINGVTYRIAENAWNNWYGYTGKRRTEMFFNDACYSAEQNAFIWLEARLEAKRNDVKQNTAFCSQTAIAVFTYQMDLPRSYIGMAARLGLSVFESYADYHDGSVTLLVGANTADWKEVTDRLDVDGQFYIVLAYAA